MAKASSFNWRGGQVTRLEALTDAVFGFAITLLVVSLDVPDTVPKLRELLSGFVAFAASFSLLIMVWVYHYKFFKRYDLDDGYTIFLNSVLLFVVLLFVYPLKFMFQAIPGLHGSEFRELSLPEWRWVFTLYGAGYCAVFVVFTALYRHAYSLRGEMELTALELIDAREHIAACFVMVGIGALSIGIGRYAPGWWAMMAGPIYGLTGLFQWLVGRRYEREKKAVQADLQAVSAAGQLSIAGEMR
jgi:uncharacterized membrane protein